MFEILPAVPGLKEIDQEKTLTKVADNQSITTTDSKHEENKGNILIKNPVRKFQEITAVLDEDKVHSERDLEKETVINSITKVTKNPCHEKCQQMFCLNVKSKEMYNHCVQKCSSVCLSQSNRKLRIDHDVTSFNLLFFQY